MLVLTLSPVPMIRGFGVLLVLGLGIALFCALTAGAAAMALTGPARARPAGTLRRRSCSPPAWAPRSPWRGARELLLDNPSTASYRAALVGAVRRPGRVLGVGLALAALGWGLDTQTRVETDITKLVPQNLSSLQNLNTLERTSGVGGEIDLMVQSQRPDKAGDDRMDELVRERSAETLRLQRHEGLWQGASVSGLLAARPVPGRRARLPHPPS